MNLPQNANPALIDRDFTILLDRSGSMSSPVGGGHAGSRWKAAEEATVALARVCNDYDPDGITVYAFGSRFQRFDNTTEEKVSQIFQQVQPSGGTELADVLRDTLLGPSGYVTRKKKGLSKRNGELILVVTDGEPSGGDAGQEAVAKVIIEASHQLTDPNELNITFIQVGDDPAAKTFLANLDDKLEAPQGQEGNRKYAKYDIVDTLTIDQMGGKNLTDVLVAAVTEHKQ